MPSSAAASSVPAIRARIFANAVSRAVDVSSPNGAKPQSSVVPSRAGSIDLGGLEHAVPDLFGRLDPRVDRVGHADEDHAGRRVRGRRSRAAPAAGRARSRAGCRSVRREA